MKKFLFLALVLAATLPLVARAQSNPPFTNPSLDPNCYFPQIGVPGEIDTIYGSAHDTIGDYIYGDGLGAYIHNLGTKPDGTPGNLLIGQGISSPIFMNQEVPTGPNFNLHNFHAIAQNLHMDAGALRFGHFHDQSHLDIFDEVKWIIYWADDDGNYDSARHTQLESNIHGSYGIGLNGVFTQPYIAHLTNDTIDDIIVGFNTSDSIHSKDSLFLDLYKGKSLNPIDPLSFEDTSIKIPPPYGNQSFHITTQGDFNGSGRDNLLIADYYKNLFFFKNDPPFSLDKLVQSMLFDTLMSRPSDLDTNIPGSYINNTVVMHALQKKLIDKSFDWVVDIPTIDSGNAIFMFRGGPDFGSHRITIDSATYVITHPQVGYEGWPAGLLDAGDLTGTGNDVLVTIGDYSTSGDLNFYVTGQALDNKIDLFYQNTLAVPSDTLTANNDSLEDLLLGNPGYDDPQDLADGKRYDGTMWLMYGSKNIPVHLNPQFSDVKSIPQKDGLGITFAPNPIAHSWSVATILWPEAEDAQYEVYNVLGSIVEKGSIRMLGGAEQERIYFPNLPDGTYVFVIHGESHEAQSKITIMR